MKIGICTQSLRMPLKQALVAASEIGARGVCINARRELHGQDLSRTALRHLLKMFEDLNLKTAALTFPTRRGFGVLADLDRRVAATKEAMSQARSLGAAVLTITPGEIPLDDESPERHLLRDVLVDLGHHGQRVGAIPALTTGRTAPDDVAAFLSEIPDGLIGIDLDPAQLIIHGHSATQAAQVLGRHVLHVTIADAVYDITAGRGDEVQLGRGTVDYPAILGALEEFEFRGWLSVRRGESSHPDEDLRNGVSWLASIED
ncbi:MAG: sugar phosphate isomerase/epimerase [Planctomycetales bacterium]|nr:sugar phosphate isomerase/epimerase [Planctomycetales bacterium]